MPGASLRNVFVIPIPRRIRIMHPLLEQTILDRCVERIQVTLISD